MRACRTRAILRSRSRAVGIGRTAAAATYCCRAMSLRFPCGLPRFLGHRRGSRPVTTRRGFPKGSEWPESSKSPVARVGQVPSPSSPSSPTGRDGPARVPPAAHAAHHVSGSTNANRQIASRCGSAFLLTNSSAPKRPSSRRFQAISSGTRADGSAGEDAAQPWISDEQAHAPGKNRTCARGLGIMVYPVVYPGTTGRRSCCHVEQRA
jgi:hypothetical protein